MARPRSPNAPIEVTVSATINEPFFHVSWVFVRRGIRHHFLLKAQQTEHGIEVKGDTFNMGYPLSTRQRDDFKRQHPIGTPLPQGNVKTISIFNPAYKSMVMSIKTLLLSKPLVDEARTSTSGMAMHRFEGFEYPTWHRSRSPLDYDPTEPDPDVLSTPQPTKIKSIADPDMNAEIAAKALAIIAEHMPPDMTGDTFAKGVEAYALIVTRVRAGLVDRQVTYASLPSGQGMATLLKGYIAILDEVLQRGTLLKPSPINL